MSHKLVICALSFLATFTVMAETKVKNPSAVALLTPEERAAMIYQRTGGMVEKQAEGKSVAIYSNQNKIRISDLSCVAMSITDSIQLPVVIEQKELKPGPSSDPRIGFAIFLTEGGAKLQFAPQDGWASLDVSWLTSDNASSDVTALRIRKQIWRALVYGLGGGNSTFAHCIMKPIFTLQELDNNKATMACPENYGKVTETAAILGIKPVFKTTYLNACREGWAPAPTNDVQKAIWEKVKAEKSVKPSNPIKVNFDPKTAPKVGE